MITQTWGGDVDFKYDHAQYWPALVSITSERVSQDFARWRELGAKVGLSEWDFKGGAKTEEEAHAPNEAAVAQEVAPIAPTPTDEAPTTSS